VELGAAGDTVPSAQRAAELLPGAKGERPPLSSPARQGLARVTQGAQGALAGFTSNRKFFPLFLLDGFKILIFLSSSTFCSCGKERFGLRYLQKQRKQGQENCWL